MKRRTFVKTILGGSSVLLLPLNLQAASSKGRSVLKFGVCADVHKDVMHDADFRLQTFMEKASEKELDFIIQLGDFCRPYDYNRDFLSLWNRYSGPKHHVLGNHDMDGGFSREQVVEFWQMPSKYYSFDCQGVHFIVLDGNDKNPSPNAAPGYPHYIGREQEQWLNADLKATSLPCILFSHQALDYNKDRIENSEQIRELLEKENRRVGFPKVMACFSGHHHIDYATAINGIYYIQINSMSYQWLGDKYKTIRYSKAVDEAYEWIKYTVPYKDPLFAFVSVDSKKIHIEGVKSSCVGPSPDDLGYPRQPENNRISPEISDRKLRLKL